MQLELLYLNEWKEIDLVFNQFTYDLVFPSLEFNYLFLLISYIISH